MQSTASTVDDYLDEAPPERVAALQALRRLCQAQLPDFDESMTYGMPCYSRNGTVEVAFASQKHNIAVYILRKDVLDAHRAALPPSSLGKGCIRYRNPNLIDLTVVQSMLMQTYAADGPVC